MPSDCRIAASAVSEGAISYDDDDHVGVLVAHGAQLGAADRGGRVRRRGRPRRASLELQRAPLKASSACAARIVGCRGGALGRRQAGLDGGDLGGLAVGRIPGGADVGAARVGVRRPSSAAAIQPGETAMAATRVRATAAVAKPRPGACARRRTPRSSPAPSPASARKPRWTHCMFMAGASGDFPIARGTVEHASAISSQGEQFPQLSHQSPACRLDELQQCNSGPGPCTRRVA